MAIKRRDLLKGGAAVAGAFTLGFALPARLRAGPAAATEPATAFAPNAFIRITPDNRVTVVVGKSEMGQNVFTALPLIVAEELDADWAAVAVAQSGVDAAFTGIGIAPDKIADLFADFKQTDATIAREYGGTGLGLAITRKFIELHKGSIWVESELGRGSTFIFEIPLQVRA